MAFAGVGTVDVRGTQVSTRSVPPADRAWRLWSCNDVGCNRQVVERSRKSLGWHEGATEGLGSAAFAIRCCHAVIVAVLILRQAMSVVTKQAC